MGDEGSGGPLDADSLFLNDLFGDGLVSDPMLGASDSITPLGAPSSVGGSGVARSEFDMPMTPE
eukprot:CAMPEP_0173461740 /NCGR_PEP_ID=MMETSP1357-20121228/65455_1 /TAXON_ID=77926 /ORGANISM="Hemiselmis rufescens, Strain PCC563" /LENGTH=63 /DNA_ID=CAMNT_0014429419 /DNA_START=203 /DNA_END=391 /DNA_ORIENTATION=+